MGLSSYIETLLRSPIVAGGIVLLSGVNEIHKV